MAKPRRTTKQSKQTGGTFLGIVLGLIVGLAIAVVVALYITRAPTPFVAKVAPPAASDTSASDAQYDPNRPLQGKTPGQPVPQANQPAPPNTAPGQTNGVNPPGGMLQEPQIVEVPPASSPAANNGVAVAPQPAQDQAASGTVKKPQQATSAPPSTAAAPASNAADANSGYFLQVGAYKTSADAEQQRARLAFQGFESKVTQRDAGGVTYYRVRIGPFSKFEDMNSARQRLSDAGVDTAVIRFTKQ
ncbi:MULTISPECIES: SPOR domain-containing protein [Paraburkholderia]|uniref:Cell division protein FtsN n=1 Tax=Paraburkholderia phenazinium TaxID=60549 RepID=A0A1N6ESK2_9BURK|nr:SPOR domain-containing protein [Paraburkholderia phenazinium]SIN85977.1 cell division protein FtsN [Paraburkholderia phenazinium]